MRRLQKVLCFRQKSRTAYKNRQIDDKQAGRVAIDAVGLSILKKLGSNRAIMEKKIFAQEQIARAVELGLGVSQPEDIEILTDDEKSRRYAEELQGILSKG